MNVGDVVMPRLGGDRREEILRSVYDGSFFRDMTALMLTKNKERREAEKKAAVEDALMALTESRPEQQKSALEQLRALHIDKLRDEDDKEISSELLLILRAMSAVRDTRLTEALEEDREDTIEGKDWYDRKVQNVLLNSPVYGTIKSDGSETAARRGEPETEA